MEASLNIDNVEQAALKAVNSEVYNIADHVPSGNAEEPWSGYWVQALPPAPRGQGSTSCGCHRYVRVRASSPGRLSDVPGV